MCDGAERIYGLSTVLPGSAGLSGWADRSGVALCVRREGVAGACGVIGECPDRLG
ncbi:hypothetical protein GCM10027088_12670 [Nocardia goodfellowii]